MQANIVLFLLLLGPSGVGKTTIIKHLKEFDEKFTYISPYVTRPLRVDETDKISVSNEKIDELERGGMLLTVNVLYGIRYATPKFPILESFDRGLYPILDWPLSKLNIMQQHFSGKLFCVYVEPPSLDSLKERLCKDGRDAQGVRFSEAEKELEMVLDGKYEDVIDLRIVNSDDQSMTVAQKIYDAYKHACAS